MANSVSHAALPYPVKGCRYSILVPYLDADGDPTDPTTPDTERSIDAAAFADCTEEVTTITGTNGMGYITLTGDELNGSLIAVAAKVASGPKNTLATLSPRVLPVLYSGTASAGAASSLTLATDIPAVADLLIGCILRTTGGTGGGGGSGSLNNQARVITDFTTGRVATVVPNWETTPDGTTTYEVLLTEGALIRYADVQLWRATQPNALVSSRVDASVGAMAADVVTAAAIANGAIDAATFAAGAIDAAAIATDAIGALELADGSITAATFAAGAIDAAAIADNALDAAAIAAGAITAAKFAAGAIDAAALAADAGTEIAAAVWNEDATGHQTQGSFGQVVGDSGADADTIWSLTNASLGGVLATAAALVTVQADTDNMQTRLPAALVGGRMDASVGAMATDVISAAALSQAAADKIIQAVSGTADSGSTTTIVDAERTEADADYWAGSIVLMTSGPAVGQVRRISAFNAATDTITVASAFTSAVAVGNTYIILRTSALEAPGAGATDWTAAEKNQIRDALGVDGSKTAATGGQLQVIDDFIDTEVAAILADTDNIQTRLPAALVSGRIDSNVGAMAADVVTAAAIAAGAIDAATFAAGAIDAAAIATDAIGAAEIAAAGANKLADHVLRRTYANARASSDGDALSFRSLLGAIGKLVNKWAIAGTTLTVYQEDDVTSTAPGGTQTITATPGADPITTLDTT